MIDDDKTLFTHEKGGLIRAEFFDDRYGRVINEDVFGRSVAISTDVIQKR